MRAIEPYFSLSPGVPRLDDRRIISGIIFDPKRPAVARRTQRLGVFDTTFAGLSAKGGKPDQLMIDAPHLKAHRTAASFLQKGLLPDVSDAPEAA